MGLIESERKIKGQAPTFEQRYLTKLAIFPIIYHASLITCEV